MATEAELREIRAAANALDRAEAAHQAAQARFKAAVEKLGQSDTSAPRRTVIVAPHHGGKAPDPNSLTQRVLKAITDSPSPVAVGSLAMVLSATPKQVRHAIVYHQKRGRIVHAGLPGQFTLKGRLNVNGAAAEH
jgi:hypothetical protein